MPLEPTIFDITEVYDLGKIVLPVRRLKKKLPKLGTDPMKEVKRSGSFLVTYSKQTPERRLYLFEERFHFGGPNKTGHDHFTDLPFTERYNDLLIVTNKDRKERRLMETYEGRIQNYSPEHVNAWGEQILQRLQTLPDYVRRIIF